MEKSQVKNNVVDLQSILYKSRSLLNNESPVNFSKLYADPKQLLDNSLKLSNKLGQHAAPEVSQVGTSKQQVPQPQLKESGAFTPFQKDSKQASFLIEDFLLQKRQELSQNSTQASTSESRDSEYDKLTLKNLAKNFQAASSSTGPATNNLTNFFPPQASLRDSSVSAPTPTTSGTFGGIQLSEDQINDKYRQSNINVISELNQHRKMDKNYLIFSKLKDNCETLPESEKNFMTKAYGMLEFLSKNKIQVAGVLRENQVKQRQYADNYSNSTDAASLSNPFWSDLIQSSKQYLQHEFYEYLVKTLQTYPQIALPGGISSRDDNIDAFIRIKFQNTSSAFILEKQVDSYIWAHLYFLLRSGFDQDACAYVSSHAELFSQSEKTFVGYFTAYMKSPQKILPDDLKQHIDREFRIKSQHTAKATDPYKLALFQLIGRCDLTQWQPPILDTKEDYLWYNLHLLKDPSGSSSDSVHNFTLYQLQNQIINLKSNYMTGPSAAFDYFKALVLLGLFEQAINFIYSSEIPNAHAVHIAIGLTYYGLLRTTAAPGNSDSLLQSSSSSGASGSGIDQLDLIRSIVRFVTGFAVKHPEDAADYLYVLGLDSRQEYIQNYHECLRELLIFTKAFEQLVGHISTEQVQTPGKFQRDWQLLHITKPDDVATEIIHKTADRCIEKNLPCDAIWLYFLAKQHSALLELAANQLSNILLNIRHTLVHPARMQEVNSFIDSIKNILVTYSQSPLEEYHKIVCSACKTLIDLRDSFIYYLQNEYSQCINSMKNSNILPLNANFRQINEFVKSSQKSHPIVIKHLPDAVFATMESLHKRYLEISKTDPQSDEIINIKLMSRNLMTFTAMMQLEFTTTVYTQLNQLDVAMI